MQGSPPLTRELLLTCLLQLIGCGITPAYAGTTRCFLKNTWVFEDHPRLRGNYNHCSMKQTA